MPGAHGRIGSRMHVDAARAEDPNEPRDEGQPIDAELFRVCGLDLFVGVLGDEPQRVIASRGQPAMRADADRRVDRLRAVVKQIERPDVEGAAREIDPRRR